MVLIQFTEGVIYRGRATGGGVNTLTDTAIPAAYITNILNDERLFIYAGTGAGQSRKIDTYDQPTHTFTLYYNWTTQPDATSLYQVISGPGSSGAGGGDATLANQTTIINRLAGGETEGTATPLDAFAGIATSGDTGADIFTIALTTRTKFHYLGIQISGLTNGAVATIRGYKKTTDAGGMREFYNQQFTVRTDPDEIPVINGTIAFRNDVRFEIKSNNAADTAVSVDYEYLPEVME